MRGRKGEVSKKEGIRGGKKREGGAKKGYFLPRARKGSASGRRRFKGKMKKKNLGVLQERGIPPYKDITVKKEFMSCEEGNGQGGRKKIRCSPKERKK